MTETGNHKRKAFTCGQCGASDLRSGGEGKAVCAFCGSVYRYTPRGASVVIRKGANVVFGKNAKVVVKGGMEVEDGASLQVDGELTLLERAPEKDIIAAKLRLEKSGGTAR